MLIKLHIYAYIFLLNRLGGGPDDAKEVMLDPFFRSMPWQDLLEKKVLTYFFYFKFAIF